MAAIWKLQLNVDNNAFPETGDADAPSDHVYVYVRNKDIIVTDKEYQEFFSFK